MTNPLKTLVLLAGFTVALASAQAQIVYIQYSGTGTASASGSVNGVAFSGQAWTLEFGVDTSVVDAETNAEVGFFPDAIVSGMLQLGSTTYTLTGTSATGDVYLTYSPGNGYGSVDTYTRGGGGGEFRGGAAWVVPAVFSDPNDLGSLNVGVSLVNTVPDGGNTSDQRFDYDPDPDTGYDHRLYTLDGHAIELYSSAPPASGNLTLSVSSAVPEPAETVAWMAGAAGLVTMIIRRCRVQTAAA